MSDNHDGDNENGVNENNTETAPDESRRKFIKNTGMVAGGVVGGSLLGGFLTNQFQLGTETENDNTQTDNLQEARMFFSRKEDFDVLKAATEQIFPEDDNGPGAVELGVPYFIDKQLAGYWGVNAKDYMKNPFRQTKEAVDDYAKKDGDQDKQGPETETQPPTPTPRYQTKLNRGDLFIAGLRKMNQVSKDKFDTKFTEAESEQQQEVMKMFENGDVKMRGVSSITFFNLLQSTTLEGVYADPVYGGNKNMQGWAMKEYPGPRMGFLQEIESEEFIKKEPKSLRDYQT